MLCCVVSSWGIFTIDSEGTVGQYSSIALDTINKYHISYYDSSNSALKYATNASGSFDTSIVDNSGSVGKYTSIAVDSNNNPYISYFDDTNDDLVYATVSNGLWQSFIVDSSVYMGEFSSITLDSSDNIHIAYYDYNKGRLKFTTNSSGLREISTIIDNSSADDFDHGYPSLTVDDTGKIYISYYDDQDNILRYVESITPVTLFSDDFESGLGNWTSDSPWGLTTSTSHGGSYSVTDSPDGDYELEINSSLPYQSSNNH